ncbi:hypothetical protein [Pseudomonas cedrina]|uniref:hypothetical protein n=1 Tax=Pseudomonas cedrina TaxID=651740 RepID=UPI0027895DB3|nr:hypothetical protein [Pseudomonas cedrina]MDQ0654006.1 hypothetical protein [Pseudomonas cedrina]
MPAMALGQLGMCWLTHRIAGKPAPTGNAQVLNLDFSPIAEAIRAVSASFQQYFLRAPAVNEAPQIRSFN